MSNPVPTYIFTGFFGTGKTTVICHMMSRKTDDEVWAVLINEFGEIGIDGALISDAGAQGGISITEIPGGCLCCRSNVPLQIAVRAILERVSPDRLLIEPTGIGHPAGILDELMSPELSGDIEVHSVVCLVDPRFIGDRRLDRVGVYQDQINLADILVANKTDLATPQELEKYQQWAARLYPPKSRIEYSSQGIFDFDLFQLNFNRSKAIGPAKPDQRHPEPAETEVPMPATGHPVRRENTSDDVLSCGWIFSPEETFSGGRLLTLITSPDFEGSVRADAVMRFKGVFNTGNEWIRIDRVGAEVSSSPIAYRRDSRMELIVTVDGNPDWDRLDRLVRDLVR